MLFGKEVSHEDENNTYFDSECEELEDTFMHCYTIRRQKEKEKKRKTTTSSISKYREKFRYRESDTESSTRCERNYCC